jgi:hypothetical protein
MNVLASKEKWVERFRQAREWQSLEGTEWDALSRDVAIPRDRIIALSRKGSGSAAELSRLMDNLSLDQDGIRQALPEVVRDMTVVCSGCTAKRMCRDRIDQSEPRPSYLEYCPNSHTLEALEFRWRVFR